MASAVKKMTSITEESKYESAQTSNLLKTTSVDFRYRSSDPDLLIREYFLSSPAQRAKLRKLVSQNISSWQSVLAILGWSRRKGVSDAYDGASDLLAECTNIDFLKDTAQYLEATSLLASSGANNFSNLEDLWEVLIKGTAYASQIPAKERFKVVLDLSQISNRRIVKAAIIDALVILADELADEMDIKLIRSSISHFSFIREPDLYIRNYAKEALQELS